MSHDDILPLNFKKHECARSMDACEMIEIIILSGSVQFTIGMPAICDGERDDAGLRPIGKFVDKRLHYHGVSQ